MKKFNFTLAENAKGHGAIKKKLDLRDQKYNRIAGAVSVPFDWSVGYDVEKETGIIAKTKDQGHSYSCGGQSLSYYIEQLFGGERSAKYPYSQIYYVTGGTDIRSLLNLATKIGDCLEELVPSYENGQAPSEFFMRDRSKNTVTADYDASKAKGYRYAFTDRTIDGYAQAIRDNKGCIMEVTGTNNGTWRSLFPVPPNTRSADWGHFIYAGKAKMVNGKKCIGVHNSWADDTGEKGWQWITEDYFKSGHVYEGGIIYKPDSGIIDTSQAAMFAKLLGLLQAMLNKLQGETKKKI